MTQAKAQVSPSAGQDSSTEHLTRVFNTALISSRASSSHDFSGELYTLMETPAFRSILFSIRHMAETQQISESEAAEALIKTFRKVDRIWSDYIYQEGVSLLKNSN